MINMGSVFLTMDGILASESAFVKASGGGQADNFSWQGGEMRDEPAGGTSQFPLTFGCGWAIIDR
jgi:hypothetical protein